MRHIFDSCRVTGQFEKYIRMLWRVIKTISHSNLEWLQFSIKAKEKKSKQTKGCIRVNWLFSMTINNSIKMFCSGTGLSYHEDNVSKFCFIWQGIIKHLFGRGLAENENILCFVKKYWTRRCLVQYFFPKHNIFSYSARPCPISV